MVRMCSQQTTHLSAPSPPTPALHASQLAASSLPPSLVMPSFHLAHPREDGAPPNTRPRHNAMARHREGEKGRAAGWRQLTGMRVMLGLVERVH